MLFRSANEESQTWVRNATLLPARAHATLGAEFWACAGAGCTAFMCVIWAAKAHASEDVIEPKILDSSWGAFEASSDGNSSNGYDASAQEYFMKKRDSPKKEASPQKGSAPAIVHGSLLEGDKIVFSDTCYEEPSEVIELPSGEKVQVDVIAEEISGAQNDSFAEPLILVSPVKSSPGKKRRMLKRRVRPARPGVPCAGGWIEVCLRMCAACVALGCFDEGAHRIATIVFAVGGLMVLAGNADAFEAQSKSCAVEHFARFR